MASIGQVRARPPGLSLGSLGSLAWVAALTLHAGNRTVQALPPAQKMTEKPDHTTHDYGGESGEHFPTIDSDFDELG